MVKQFKILLLSIFLVVTSSYSQDKACCTTYTYEGFIETDNGKKLTIKLNYLVLLDSTIVGSYYYTLENGSLKLIGHFNNDNSFHLVERDKRDSITGWFFGQLLANKSKATGQWKTARKDKTFKFELSEVKAKTYWDIIKKNRALFEYKDLQLAIKEFDKVLSIDVASQSLTQIPKKLSILTKINSINLLGNKFKRFPTVLSKLKTLDEISLSSNDMEHVGSEIGKLTNLKILIMNFNRLKSLPSEIGNLTNLQYLEIGNNQLSALPERIKYLTNLQELHIERNNITEKEKKRIKRLLPNCVIHF